MRQMIWLGLLLPSTLSAVPQFSQQECQKLNAERREIRLQLSQPYTPEQGKQLQAREQELLRLLKAHCRQPVKVPPQLPLPDKSVPAIGV